MTKKILIFIFFSFFLNNISYSAGNNSIGQNTDSKKWWIKSEPSKKVKDDFQKGLREIKKAKKLDKKGKTEKAKIKYQKAFGYFLDANDKNVGEPDILNYLGFSSRKLGDFKNAEIYYRLGLDADPNHFGINEYLGELYVITGRVDKAKERLKVLENCKCDEYAELEKAIKTGSSKY